MKIILPAQINPPRLRKDGSAALTFDTRELSSEEIFTVMALRQTEGWLTFSPNPDDIEIPETPATREGKTVSERIRATMYVWYKQECEAGKFTGLFDTFYKERGERIIEGIKSKLN